MDLKQESWAENTSPATLSWLKGSSQMAGSHPHSSPRCAENENTISFLSMATALCVLITPHPLTSLNLDCCILFPKWCVQVLTPGLFNVTLFESGDFAYSIKLRISRWGYPGFRVCLRSDDCCSSVETHRHTRDTGKKSAWKQRQRMEFSQP